MIKDYSDKSYLREIQDANRYSRKVKRALKGVAYIVAGTVLFGALTLGTHYLRESPTKENPQFSQLQKKLNQENAFNEAIFKAGGQLK